MTLLGVADLINALAKKRGIYSLSAFLCCAVADGIGRYVMHNEKWNRYISPDPESTPRWLVFLGYGDAS